MSKLLQEMYVAKELFQEVSKALNLSLLELRRRNKSEMIPLSVDCEGLERLLIESFESSLSTEEKKKHLHLLALFGKERGLSFLFSCIKKSSDLTLVSEAVVSLGASQDFVAQNFLLSLLRDKKSFFRRESLLSLSRHPLLPLAEEAKKILLSKKESSSLKSQALISSAKSLRGEDFSFILDLLQKSYSEDSQVFNAALLASSYVAQEHDFEDLQSFNLSFRYFASELRDQVIEKVSRRSLLSSESILLDFKSLKEEDSSFQEALILLKNFDREETINLAKKIKLGPSQEAYLRYIFRGKSFEEEDCSFWKAHIGSLSLQFKALLLTLFYGEERKERAKTIFEALSKEDQVKVLKISSYGKSFEFFVRELNEKSHSPQLKQDLLGAVSAQCFLQDFREEKKKNLVTLLFGFIKNEKDLKITSRAARVLYETDLVEFGKKSDLIEFYKQGKIDQGSFFLLAGKLSWKEVSSFFQQALKDLSQHKDERALYFLLERLSLFEEDLDLNLASFKKEELKAVERPLLKILAKQKLADYSLFLEEALQSSSQECQILALRGVQLNPSPECLSKVQEISVKSEGSLQRACLETLSVAGSFEAHAFLFQNLIFTGKVSHFLIDLFPLIKKSEDTRYQPLLEEIQKRLVAKSLPFEEEEAYSAGVAFCDKFSFQSSSSKIGNSHQKEHDLDRKIQEEFPCYQGFSPVVKSVLRNAELTWHHKDLFDALVDKSTMIIEYTKSLEILLQEKLGRYLFLEPEMFQKALQTRLVYLKFNEPRLRTEDVIQRLQASSHFSRINFPKAKFIILITSILSGRFSNDQYRILDGLRSWAVLFVVFFRDYKSEGKELKSLLNLKEKNDKALLNIAESLNRLQEVRNIAAHRGTFFNLDRMSEVRKKSFQLLEALDRLFQSHVELAFSKPVKRREPQL